MTVGAIDMPKLPHMSKDTVIVEIHIAMRTIHKTCIINVTTARSTPFLVSVFPLMVNACILQD